MSVRQLIILLFCSLPLFLVGQSLPDGFYDVPIAENLDFPIGVTFDATGRMYSWEKGGRVWVYDTEGNRAPEPFIDLHEEVAHYDEHGLNYFLLDRNFMENGHIYLYYVLDRHHYLTYGTADYDPDFSLLNDATIARITRYTANPDSEIPLVDLDSRNILLGRDMPDGIPILMVTHGAGSLQQGDDGTLLVSCGDGASFTGTDIGSDSLGSKITNAIEYGILEEHQDLGSYRSQYLGVLNGKVLRLDPETGNGLPSNPYFRPGEPRHPASRTWAMGFRNPYRFVLKPESGSTVPSAADPGFVILGDVGSAHWEEFNVIPRGGLNFGWPIMEGNRQHWGFHNADDIPNPYWPNPFFGNGSCNWEFLGFKQLLRNPNPARDNYYEHLCAPGNFITEEDGFRFATPPTIFWSNRNFNPPFRAATPIWNVEFNGYMDRVTLDDERSLIEGENFAGESSLGGVFYSGDNFPEEYRNAYFHVDYSGWIKIFDFNEQNELYRVRNFADFLERPVHLTQNPLDGNLYYVSLEEESIHQIGFGGNPPPVAVIEETQFFGAGDLTVNFDASESYDPNLTELSFSWDFDDGSTATSATPSHTFAANGSTPTSYRVKLTVTDSEGATDEEEILVSLNNSPPLVDITSFENNDRYPTDRTTLLDLNAEVSDPEHATDELEYEWQVFFHHNTHFHPERRLYTANAHAFIQPAGCSEEIFWYRVRLKVSDPEGLSTTVEQNIYPNCETAPENWVELEPTAEDNRIKLDVTTDLPPGVDFIEIQRSIETFYDYQGAGRQDFDPDQNYTFLDTDPWQGTTYYRVRARMQDGGFYYSDPVPVTFPAELAHKVFPNPAQDFIDANLKEAAAGNVYIELFSISGKQVFKVQYNIPNEGFWEQRLNVSDLPRGMYLYRIENETAVHSGKIMLD